MPMIDPVGIRLSYDSFIRDLGPIGFNIEHAPSNDGLLENLRQQVDQYRWWPLQVDYLGQRNLTPEEWQLTRSIVGAYRQLNPVQPLTREMEHRA